MIMATEAVIPAPRATDEASFPRRLNEVHWVRLCRVRRAMDSMMVDLRKADWMDPIDYVTIGVADFSDDTVHASEPVQERVRPQGSRRSSAPTSMLVAQAHLRRPIALRHLRRQHAAS